MRLGPSPYFIYFVSTLSNPDTTPHFLMEKINFNQKKLPFSALTKQPFLGLMKQILLD